MRVHKILAATAAAVTLAGGVMLTMAPAASAADVALTISCEAGNPKNVATEVVAQPGSRIVIAGPNCFVGGFELSDAYLFTSRPVEGPTGTFTFVVASDVALGTYGNSGVSIFGVDNDLQPGGGTRCFGELGDTTCGAAFYLTITDGSVPSTTGSPSIPVWVQAYGRASAGATCLEGWYPSWESWAEPVTGGWVCTRSIASRG
jgi:hypothetical protein